ncbi:MAG: FHA domain-containing protein [Muribaculaceae bacterium]|nr:FHA domain-containing protein [Muribaculaceae bacterium]
MGEIKLNKNGKNGIINNDSLKGGVKKEQIKDSKLQPVFDFADKNSDGVLDNTELAMLLDALNTDKDETTISGGEAKKYLSTAKLNKELKKEDLYKFLQDLTAAADSIENSTVEDSPNGDKLVTINYKDGTFASVKTLQDKSFELCAKDAEGNVTTQFFNADKQLVKTIVQTKDGKITETMYVDDKTPERVTTTNSDGSVEVVDYQEGKPSTRTYKKGGVVENYTYNADGNEVLNSRVENVGIEAKERRTQFTYNDDETTTTVTTEVGKKTTRNLKDGKMFNETVETEDRNIVTTIAEDGTETIKTSDKEGHLLEEVVKTEGKTVTTSFNNAGAKTKEVVETEGKTVTTTFKKGGARTEVVVDSKGETTTEFNARGKRLSQTIVANGQVYEAEYDGKGNTYVIVQNNELPAMIAKKFGVNVNVLLRNNKHTTNSLGDKDFGVGAKIKVPGEFNANHKGLLRRKDSKGASRDYVTSGGAANEAAANQKVANRKNITWTEQKYNTFLEIAKELFRKEGNNNPSRMDLDKRIKDLKKDNPTLKDGELKGKKIIAGVDQNYYDKIAEAERKRKEEEAKRKAEEAARQEAIVQKKSAAQIVNNLIAATDWSNDLKKIQSEIAKIDNPVELAEVNRLLSAKGYKADDIYSPIEKFIYEENNHSSVHMYNSTDYMEKTVQKWIANGTLKGDDAINAQARMAARVIFDAGDGFGTDCTKTKKGIYMIKAPTGNDKAAAKKVYEKVNWIVKRHATFYGLGSASKDLSDYLDGELWDGEVKYLRGILAESNAIQGAEKAQAVADLVDEAVSGGGTDIEYLEQAIKAIDSPADMKAIEPKLRQYCKDHNVKYQYAGQSPLQAILYDECDTFMGISTDHKEIRKFNEMLIKQGAYSKDQIVKIRAEQAALQILDGGFDGAKDALLQIKDPKVLAYMDNIFKAKKQGSLNAFLNSKFKNQTQRDLLKAELAANKLLSDTEAANVAFRLIQKSDFDTRAKGIAAIRTSAQAEAVDKALKQKGSSLAAVMEKFNKEKEEYKKKAAIWDGIAAWCPIPGSGIIGEHISDQYRENTDVSDNLYLEAKTPIKLDPAKQATYCTTVTVLEEKLNKVEEDYKNARSGQGVVSGAINEFCSIYNIGTTRDEVEARIEHDKETVRLLKLAAEGKLQKMVNGKLVNVSFETVFKERQSAFITANGASVSAIKNAVSEKPQVNFDPKKVAKVEQQGQRLAAMDYAKDYIGQVWDELGSAISSNSSSQLSVAIYSALEKYSTMLGQQLSLDNFGYSFKNGVIVDKNGDRVSAAALKPIATQLKDGLSDISKSLLGVSLPKNASTDKVNDLLNSGYDKKLEGFKQEYRDAFGQDCPDEMIDSYLSTINNGMMVLNIGVAIGAIIAAPFTGGGSLAVFCAAAGSSLLLNGLEHSTDANGLTNEEWTKDFGQAAWDGALAVAGMKIGTLAESFAKGGSQFASINKWLTKLPKAAQTKVIAKAEQIFQKLESTTAKIGQKAINAQKAKIQSLFPKMNPDTVNKAAIFLARAEAAGFEITSDSLQSLLQMYCMEGEFNAESFIMGMVMSIAGNSAGHVFGAVGDARANSRLKATTKEAHVEVLSNIKRPDGSQLFSADDINAIVDNLKTDIPANVIFSLADGSKAYPNSFKHLLESIDTPEKARILGALAEADKVKLENGAFVANGKKYNLDAFTIQNIMDHISVSKLGDGAKFVEDFFAMQPEKIFKGLDSFGLTVLFGEISNQAQQEALHSLVQYLKKNNISDVTAFDVKLRGLSTPEDTQIFKKYVEKYLVKDYDGNVNTAVLNSTFFKECADTPELGVYRRQVMDRFCGEDLNKINKLINNIDKNMSNSTKKVIDICVEEGKIPSNFDDIVALVGDDANRAQAFKHMLANDYDGLILHDILENITDEKSFKLFNEYKDWEPSVVAATMKKGEFDNSHLVKRSEAKMQGAERVDEALRKLPKKLGKNLEAQITNFANQQPKRFMKMVDAGLFDLIDEGKVSPSILENVDNNTFLSNRTLDEIRRIKNNEPYVKTLTSIAEISNVKNGNVAEINGKLYVNDNGNPVELNVSREKFEELFPPLESVTFKQGSLGDCWLVSSLDSYMDLPGGRVALYKLLRQEGDDIIVQFPGASGSVKFSGGKVLDAGGKQINGRRGDASCPGIQMIEQAFAVHRYNKYTSADVPTDIMDFMSNPANLMLDLKGGWQKEVNNAILGRNDAYKYGMDVSSQKEFMQMLEQYGNDENVLLHFATKSKPHEAAESTLSAEYDLYSNHAYVLKGYDAEKGVVYITNPWHTSVVTEVPVYDFMNYVQQMGYTKIVPDAPAVAGGTTPPPVPTSAKPGADNGVVTPRPVNGASATYGNTRINYNSIGQSIPTTKGQKYVFPGDNFPILELPGGEIVDLNSPEIAKKLYSLREGESFVIGRQGDYPTNPDNRAVSRQHTVIYKQDGKLKFLDNSTYGTTYHVPKSEPKKLKSGTMDSSQPYILDVNDLPTLNLAGVETVNLANYKSQIESLQNGQMLTIGREGDITVSNNRAVSRQHLIIYNDNGQIKIKDVSTYGTNVEKAKRSFFDRFKRRNNVVPEEEVIIAKVDVEPITQSNNFANTSHIGGSEYIADGFRDGGRRRTFDENGNISRVGREIVYVDRAKDTALQSIISDVQRNTAGMNAKQKAAYLQQYINDLIGDGSTAERNLQGWVARNSGCEVMLGDIVTHKPPIAVCRHRSLLYKILGDELGLNVELQRGNFWAGGGGGHAWNVVRFDDGTSAIFDAMHNKTSEITPGRVDNYAKFYYTVDNVALY